MASAFVDWVSQRWASRWCGKLGGRGAHGPGADADADEDDDEDDVCSDCAAVRAASTSGGRQHDEQEHEQSRHRHHEARPPLHRQERRARVVEEHDLDDAQVVVGGNHARQHADDRQRVKPRLYRRREHVELGEEAGERRHARHGEQDHGKDEGHGQVGLGEARERIDLLDHAGVATHGEDACKGPDGHEQIDRQVDDDGLGAAPQWQQIVVFLSIASMLLGAFAAIGQTNIKRLMAYSSIGHIGYALIGLAADSEAGTQSVLVYLAIYLFMTVGAFACILSMRNKLGPVEDIESLAGLAKTNLPMAFVLAMILFSMAGIPPLAGFFAKFYVFAAAIKAGLYPLAIIGVLASVVAAYYYLRVVKIMFFDEAQQEFVPAEQGTRFVMVIAGLFVLLFVLAPAPLVDSALAAARALQVGQ